MFSGPNYGHFVSKDFINWAPLPTAIWNGLDSSTTPFTVTNYDRGGIWSGSAQVFEGAGPGGKGKGIVTVYPGLCDKMHWPACGTGYVLAQAVPADYRGDQLLTNWTKPGYNPIVENATRDPTSAWKTPSGSWRLTTFSSHVFEAESDAAVLKGQWKDLGHNPDFRSGSNVEAECPSFYPLPAATPGTEAAYHAAQQQEGGLPTHVRKTSCDGDWWQLGTYDAKKMGEMGSFVATPGWEDLWPVKELDRGNFYASKDNAFPTLQGGSRRINWGWATLGDASSQNLPREITFNAAARTLQQYPIKELQALRGKPVSTSAPGPVKLPPGTANHSEIVATFTLPETAATLGVMVSGADNATTCSVDYVPGAKHVNVSCSSSAPCFGRGHLLPDGTTSFFKDTVSILSSETTFEIRVFSDATFLEVFFQKGRAAMTIPAAMSATTELSVLAPVKVGVNATAWPMRGIWVTPDAVRAAPRVYT